MSSTHTSTDETPTADREFREALSQLVQQHLAAGESPATVIDALELQTEVVRAKGPGTITDESPADTQHDSYNRR